MNGRRLYFELSLITVALILASDFVSANTPQLYSVGSNSTDLTGMTVTVSNVAGRVDSSSSSGNFYRPPQVPLDAQLYPETPEGLNLQQVHVFVRHGERSPVGVRLASSIPQHWMLCKTARQFPAIVSDLTDEGGKGRFIRSRQMVERSDGTVVDGECFLGELTDVGRQSTFEYGRALRKLYVDKLGFLPDTLPKRNETYFRSTNLPRTIESLEQVVHGLYPTSKCARDALPVIFVRNGKDENLLGNTSACKRLEILQVGFAQAAAAIYNPSLTHLDKKLSKYLDGKPIRVDGKPRASGIMDTIRAAIANGIKVPNEFEDKSIVDVIENAVVNEWFADKTEEVRRLGMGPLLADMTRKMQNKVDKGSYDPLKILVHSTHDTALAALCATLDVFDNNWPAFTASITFELFKKANEKTSPNLSQSIFSSLRSDSSEHFVRMRHQNKNMVLPICAEEGKHFPGHPEFCTLAAFRDRVKELTPVDWENECAPAGKPL